MYLIEKTIEFDMWLKKLRDKTARAKILFRLQRVELENCRNQLILLLIGRDKSTQEKDIEKARKIWDNYQKK